MSLFASPVMKIPCVLITAVGIHCALTPPARSSKDERAPHVGVWAKIVQLGVAYPWLFKSVFWSISLAELATIVANEYPSTEASKRVLSALTINGHRPDVHFTPLAALSFSFICFGGFIRMWCYRMLQECYTFELSIRENHKLVKAGPYSVVRHPAYTGTMIGTIGTLCWFGGRGSWLQESGVLDTVAGKALFGVFTLATLGVAVGLFKRAYIEDAMMKKTFGKEWEEWYRSVPAAFIPGVW